MTLLAATKNKGRSTPFVQPQQQQRPLDLVSSGGYWCLQDQLLPSPRRPSCSSSSISKWVKTNKIRENWCLLLVVQAAAAANAWEQNCSDNSTAKHSRSTETDEGSMWSVVRNESASGTVAYTAPNEQDVPTRPYAETTTVSTITHLLLLWTRRDAMFFFFQKESQSPQAKITLLLSLLLFLYGTS